MEDINFDSDSLIDTINKGDVQPTSNSYIYIFIIIFLCSCYIISSLISGVGYYVYRKYNKTCLFNSDCAINEICYNKTDAHCVFNHNKCIGKCKCTVVKQRNIICNKQIRLDFSNSKLIAIPPEKNKIVFFTDTFNKLTQYKYNTCNIDFVKIQFLCKVDTIHNTHCIKNFIYFNIYNKNKIIKYTTKNLKDEDIFVMSNPTWHMPVTYELSRDSLNNLKIDTTDYFELIVTKKAIGCELLIKDINAHFYFMK